MKLKQILVGALMLVSSSLLAQENENQKTIFGPNDGSHVDWGMDAAIRLGYSNIDDRDAINFGCDFGAIRNHNLEMGVFIDGTSTKRLYDSYAYLNSTTSTTTNTSYSSTSNEEYGYDVLVGGIYFRPIFYSSSPVHFSIPIRIGGGVADYCTGGWDCDYDEPWGRYDYDSEDHCGVFVFEPGVSVDFNLFRHFHLSAGVSYRFYGGVDLWYTNYNYKIVSNDGLNALSYTLTMRIGMF